MYANPRKPKLRSLGLRPRPESLPDEHLPQLWVSGDVALGKVMTMLWRTGAALPWVVVLGAVGVAAWQFGRERVAAEVYRARSERLADDFNRLRENYHRAIARTAITALVVEDGRVFVETRHADGTVVRRQTPFHAAREIFVDYAVVAGRIRIRRVFDAATPAADAFVLDAGLAEIDWQGADHGKAVYRRLAEGRWEVTVTGNGALGLRRAEAGELEALPQLEAFEAAEAPAEAGGVRPGEVVAYWRDLLLSW